MGSLSLSPGCVLRVFNLCRVARIQRGRWLSVFGCLFLGLFLASEVGAQITIPDEVELGEPIVAGCECVVPEGSETRVSWSLQNLGKGKAQFVPDTGTDFTVYVWAEPGKYKLTNSVVYVQYQEIEVPTADGGTQTIKSLIDFGLQNYEREFTVVGKIPSPDPEPDPDPDPDPDVPVPDDKWDLGKTIYRQAMKLPVSVRSKASALADNFDAVGAGIAAGQFARGGFQSAQKELADRNRSTVGADKDAWNAAFTELFRHMQERRVPTTLEAYADAYAFIAKGLRAVR